MTPKYPEAVSRIEENMEADTNGGCWLWRGAISTGSGYGNIKHDSRFMGAHRLSYAAHTGDPSGASVLHKCDIPLCVNPDHLFLGSGSDNMRDMFAKGRRPPNVTVRPLRNEEVSKIAFLTDAGLSRNAIAKVMGRAPRVVGRIRRILREGTNDHEKPKPSKLPSECYTARKVIRSACKNASGL